MRLTAKANMRMKLNDVIQNLRYMTKEQNNQNDRHANIQLKLSLTNPDYPAAQLFPDCLLSFGKSKHFKALVMASDV